jgi:16S rRNA processing protein RimM
MHKDDCFYLGHVTRSVGFKGEVVVFIDADNPENYSDLKMLYLDVRGKLIPYFTVSVGSRNKGNQLTIKFQDVDSEEQADQLQGCEIYLPLLQLPPLSGNAFYFHEIPGYSVKDKHKGDIGTISRILDYPNNPLFEISYGNKEILIPVRDQFIEKLDRENKIIYLIAPEGLIDIYLNEEQP